MVDTENVLNKSYMMRWKGT